MKYNCIVIGAGAAGLIASDILSRKGYRVRILEARNRPGGRICTLPIQKFSRPAEAGAEFIHGNDVPVTQSILKEAGVHRHEVKGEMYRIENGKLQKSERFGTDMKLLLDQLKTLKTDMPFAEFLQQKFPADRYKKLHESIKRFVEGYNAADTGKASAMGLEKEWSREEDPSQYRPAGGYVTLINYLYDKILQQGATIDLSATVKAIRWLPGNAEAEMASGKIYRADKIMITVPLGILQHDMVNITPSLPLYYTAINNIGFGAVIKFLFEFKSAFWEQLRAGKIKSPGFLFTDAFVPTWWSQLPDETPMLTGWLGGPAVEKIHSDKHTLFLKALESLGYIFDCSQQHVAAQIKAWNIFNWRDDPFTKGAYSYNMPDSSAAKKILNTPVHNTLYFAGEALYEGPHTGTVEAALTSGCEAALRMNASEETQISSS